MGLRFDFVCKRRTSPGFLRRGRGVHFVVDLFLGFLIYRHEGVEVVIEMYAYSGRHRIRSRVD